MSLRCVRELWGSFGYDNKRGMEGQERLFIVSMLGLMNGGNEVPLMDLFTPSTDGIEEDEKNKVVDVVTLGVLHGCLCLSTVTNLSRAIWIMKEYGVKESWVKLFEGPHGFGAGPYYVRFSYDTFRFCQGLKDEILVRNNNSKARAARRWFNIGSETCSRTEEIVGLPLFEEVCFLNGSLVSIPNGEKIIIPSDRQRENKEG